MKFFADCVVNSPEVILYFGAVFLFSIAVFPSGLFALPVSYAAIAELMIFEQFIHKPYHFPEELRKLIL